MLARSPEFLRAETYAAANAPLITAQADIGLAQVWGGGLVAAVDGIRVVVPVHSADARPSPKFFGHRRGMTLLNRVTDQGVGVAGQVVSGTPRDSLHVIDLIYRQDSGPRPEVIISDTGSYGDMVCGLMPLLGFDYRPQLADLPDPKLWRITPGADYGPLHTAARARSTLGGAGRTGPTCCASSVPSTPARSARMTCCGCCSTGVARPSSARRWRTTGGSSRSCTCPTSIKRPTGRRSRACATCRNAATPATRLPRPPR